MTESTEDRISRLSQILYTNAPHLDMEQVSALISDLAVEAERQETKRVADILTVAYRRISQSKGRVWRQEIEQAIREVECGHRRLFDVGQ